MSTYQAPARPTIDVNKNGIQTCFDFVVEETPAKKALKQIKKKHDQETLQLQLLKHTPN